jgi:hypothetical protein
MGRWLSNRATDAVLAALAKSPEHHLRIIRPLERLLARDLGGVYGCLVGGKELKGYYQGGHKKKLALIFGLLRVIIFIFSILG